MTSCRTETETVSRMEKAGLLLQPSSVSGVPLVSGLTEDIRGTLMAHYVKLMMIIVEFGILQFHRYVYCQYVTCVKRMGIRM